MNLPKAGEIWASKWFSVPALIISDAEFVTEHLTHDLYTVGYMLIGLGIQDSSLLSGDQIEKYWKRIS